MLSVPVPIGPDLHVRRGLIQFRYLVRGGRWFVAQDPIEDIHTPLYGRWVQRLGVAVEEAERREKTSALIGVEFNLKYLGDFPDDSFDIDTGAKADIEYAIAVQRAGAGDNALELDSPDGDYDFTALPRTNAQFANFTFWAAGSGSQAIRARGQADLTMVNGVVVKAGNCLRIDEEDDAAAGSRDDENGPPMFLSTAFDCDTNATLDTYAAGTLGPTSW